MLIFIDTEFTDFKDTELISIGLVTDNGAHEFYVELPVDQSRCNDFVLATVLPQLCKVPGAQCSFAELKNRLMQWLVQFAYRAPVTICYDFDGDWQLLCHALNYEIPVWLTGQNVYPYIDQVALQMFFIDNRLKEHHALNDAKANRHAYDRKKARADMMKFRGSR
ncbi:3'-5' exoribonuclease [Herminiimonas sp. CN]|uniref:3'-5' exoribonuclease n=1 Tax=Herminiimonas sp. CN TaxID=1349818 RepID=UPI0004739120|nr:3'-5' exoribonuclease [Herminiimonas sp. CN]